MQWIAIITTLLNALMRLYGMFFKKGGSGGSTPASSTTTSRSDDRATVPGPAAPSSRSRQAPPPSMPTSKAGQSDGGIGELFKQQRSDVQVTASGIVVKVLPDDTDTSDGSEQHQKFLVELPPAGPNADAVTIRICSNLKFGRIPVAEGERVSFCGEYEWTEYGGTVHWTHRDPRGTHPDGWIEHNGRRYE
ncbi:MAG: DUF3465 domain-containing protein [Tepidisphaeraceae bacterium]